jgi:hypothetical protein
MSAPIDEFVRRRKKLMLRYTLSNLQQRIEGG